MLKAKKKNPKLTGDGRTGEAGEERAYKVLGCFNK